MFVDQTLEDRTGFQLGLEGFGDQAGCVLSRRPHPPADTQLLLILRDIGVVADDPLPQHQTSFVRPPSVGLQIERRLLVPQIVEAHGQLVRVTFDIRVVANELVIHVGRMLEGIQGLFAGIEIHRDETDSIPRLGRLGADRAVRSSVAEELLVILPGRLQEFLAQGLEPGDIEQLALADPGEILVDGLAGLLEIGLGPDPLVLGPGVGAAQEDRAGGQPDDRRDEQRGRACDQRAMASRPTACSVRERIAVGQDGFVGHPPLDLGGQQPGRGVSGRRAFSPAP